MADSAITPANIVAGALVAQTSLVAIMFIAFAIINRRLSVARWSRSDPDYSSVGTVILLLFLVSVVSLALSEPLATTWKPLFSGIAFDGFSWSKAIFAVFIVDILVVSVLVGMTGGSVASPFQPLYFLLPTLALLLRSSSPSVVLYTLLVAGSFTFFLFSDSSVLREDAKRHKIAYGVVSILCLALACFIGIFTRPS